MKKYKILFFFVSIGFLGAAIADEWNVNDDPPPWVELRKLNGADPSSPEPIVYMGYYERDSVDSTMGKLIYVELYGRVTNKWYGLMDIVGDQLILKKNAEQPESHVGLRWWEILSEKLPESERAKGFHEFLRRKKDSSGKWDLSNKPWRLD